MILDQFRLDGRVAVVTGGGRGIGAATAVALAEVGADVLIAARSEDDLGAVAEKIVAVGREVEVVGADLSDPAAAAQLAGRAVDRFGRLDIVVNNVGGEMPQPLLSTTVDRLEAAFRFNVSTAHALTTAAVPALLAAGGGAVVNISSVMGRLSARGFAAYGTVKAALAHYTRLAAADLSPRIRVNAIACGSIDTSALDRLLSNDDLRASMEARTPLRRIGDPQDIAAAVVYLASPAGGYVTGAVLEVDGGLRTPNLNLGLPDL